jgi:hypothetical protein
MGMFDSIRCEYALPLNEELKQLDIKWNEIEFQTKCLDSVMDQYILTKEGKLLKIKIEREYIHYTEEERKDKKPWDLFKDIIEISKEEIEVNYHGKITFYCYEPYSETEDFSVDFDAYFSYGNLDKVDLVRFEKYKSNKLRNEEIFEKYKKEQKSFKNKLKRYSGWNYFWTKMAKFTNKLSNILYLINAFIYRNFL